MAHDANDLQARVSRFQLLAASQPLRIRMDGARLTSSPSTCLGAASTAADNRPTAANVQERIFGGAGTARPVIKEKVSVGAGRLRVSQEKLGCVRLLVVDAVSSRIASVIYVGSRPVPGQPHLKHLSISRASGSVILCSSSSSTASADRSGDSAAPLQRGSPPCKGEGLLQPPHPQTPPGTAPCASITSKTRECVLMQLIHSSS